MAQSRDSGLGRSDFTTMKELYGPLTECVKDTVLKLVERNSGKGGCKDVSLWAAQQVKKMVEHSANHTVAQIIKSEEERRKREKEAEAVMKFFSQLLTRQRGGDDEGNVTDHGTGVVEYPWEKKKRLGQGGFGVVYLATDSNGFDFAVKEVLRSGQEADCLKTEIECLSKLSHENIVNYYGYAIGRGKIFMYLELMTGSIKDKMNQSGLPLDVTTAQKYTRDALRGLVYLHSNDIIHRDIKCGNILLDKTDRAKLADMGLSKTHEEETMLTYDDKAGAIFWMSPEILTNHAAGKRSDVWSVGCTVYEMLKSMPPFADQGLFAAIFGIQSGQLVHRDLVDQDETIVGSVESFLKHIFVDFDRRPYADGIAQHKWILDY